jgi:hypothetical protein
MISSKITMSFTIASTAVALAGALAFFCACEVPAEGRGAKAASDGTASGTGECQNDKDCKGNRICEKGVCTSPR